MTASIPGLYGSANAFRWPCEVEEVRFVKVEEVRWVRSLPYGLGTPTARVSKERLNGRGLFGTE